MPYFAEQNDDLVSPTEVSKGARVFCPFCGAKMGIREAHFNRGQRIHRHFFHVRGGDCGGESDIHRRMKAIARYTLQQIFPMARVKEEVKIGDRYADVAAHLSWPLKPFGKGVVVEVQHKHKEKRIGQVSQEFLNQGYSVYWAYQSDFDWSNKEMRIVEKRARTVWPDVLPDREGTEGYPGVTRKLWNGDYQGETAERVTIPPEYWEAHALEVTSPRHGEYQSDWDLIDDFWLGQAANTIAWVAVNRSPTDRMYIEMWTKPQSGGKPTHLPLAIRARDFETLLRFVEDIQTEVDIDRQCSTGQREVLVEAPVGDVGPVAGWIALVDDVDGQLSLEFGRTDRHGNCKTLSKPYHREDADALDEVCHRLSQYIQSVPVH